MDGQRRARFGSLVLAAAFPTGLVYWRYRHDMSRAYQRIATGGVTIETARGPIQYTESGEGPPVLIVHGSGGGYDHGALFAGLIGGGYRWIAPSRFGFLGSPVPEGAESALQADAYAGLLDALGIERVGVVAVSMGGPSALLFAIRHPQRTTSLVLVSAASHALPPRPPVVAAIFNVFLHDFVYWSMVRTSRRGLLATLGVPLEVQRQLTPREEAKLQDFLQLIEPMAARRAGQLLEQHMSEYHAPEIQAIQAPTLVVHARDDTLVPFEHGSFAAGQIASSELLPMEVGGHLALMLGRNTEARVRIRGFLARFNAR
jgi:pimeloyl-ACP methyl ester carboxylesterase